jgi:hypothetical protein
MSPLTRFAATLFAMLVLTCATVGADEAFFNTDGGYNIVIDRFATGVTVRGSLLHAYVMLELCCAGGVSPVYT